MRKQYLVDFSDARISILRNLYPEAFVDQTIDLDLLFASWGIMEDQAFHEKEAEQSGEEYSHWLIPWIENRITGNRNANLVFVGDTGSGKSYAAISLAEQVDPNFSADRIVFTTREFISLVNSDLPKGAVIIFDDAGLGIPAREWQRLSAKIFGKLFQGFRYKNLVSMITVPDISFIERQSRLLMHLYFEATDTQGIMKPFRPFHPFRGDDRLGFRYPTQQIDRHEMQIKTTMFPLPSSEITSAYESKKLTYMEATNKAFQLELEYSEMMEQKAQKEREKRIAALKEKKGEDEKWKEKKEQARQLMNSGYTQREIAKELKVSRQWVSKVKGA